MPRPRPFAATLLTCLLAALGVWGHGGVERHAGWRAATVSSGDHWGQAGDSAPSLAAALEPAGPRVRALPARPADSEARRSRSKPPTQWALVSSLSSPASAPRAGGEGADARIANELPGALMVAGARAPPR